MEIHHNGTVVKFTSDGLSVLAEKNGVLLPPIALVEKFVISGEVFGEIERTFGRIQLRMKSGIADMQKLYPGTSSGYYTSYATALILQLEAEVQRLKGFLRD